MQISILSDRIINTEEMLLVFWLEGSHMSVEYPKLAVQKHIYGWCLVCGSRQMVLKSSYASANLDKHDDQKISLLSAGLIIGS